jgi:hypothetical protein
MIKNVTKIQGKKKNKKNRRNQEKILKTSSWYQEKGLKTRILLAKSGGLATLDPRIHQDLLFSPCL